LLLVSEIEHLYIDSNIQEEDGWLNLQKADTVTINGLDGYAKPQLLDRFPYARPKTT
jgi:hypothetical protein